MTTLALTNTARGENAALSYRNLRAIIGYVGLALPAVLLVAITTSTSRLRGLQHPVATGA